MYLLHFACMKSQLLFSFIVDLAIASLAVSHNGQSQFRWFKMILKQNCYLHKSIICMNRSITTTREGREMIETFSTSQLIHVTLFYFLRLFIFSIMKRKCFLCKIQNVSCSSKRSFSSYNLLLFFVQFVCLLFIDVSCMFVNNSWHLIFCLLNLQKC